MDAPGQNRDSGSRRRRSEDIDLLDSIASLLKVDINLEESRDFAAEVIKEGSHAVRSKVGETTQVLDQVIKKEAGDVLQRISSGAESALQKIQQMEENVADGIGGFASGFKEQGARVADEIDDLTDKILRKGVEKAAIADQFVKERGDVLNDVVGVAAKRADELVDNAGKTVGMAAKRADELVDNAGKTVGMAAQRADELVDTAASTAKGLRDNTTHIVGDILQNSTKNVMEGIETLEWVPEWKEALEGLHRNLESTVHDQWDRLHGLEVVEEADDVDGYEYMEGESYEAMIELSKHLCSDVHEHHTSGTDQQPATGLCSDYQTEHSNFEMGDTSVSLRSSHVNDTVGQQQRMPPLTGNAAYRRSYDSLKKETPRDGVSALSGPRGFSRSSSADKGGTLGRRSSLLMQTTPGSQRHVASLAVRMQELGMSEDIIRSNLEESTKSPANIVSPHATAPGSNLKSRSLEAQQLSWNPMEASASPGSGRGSSGQVMPPLSEETRALLDSVRYRVIELANTGGAFMKGLVERYAHLLNNHVFVERYLVSREKNVEVTARKLLAHFEWRMVYKIDGIMDEDWSDLDASGELMLAGLDKQGHSGWIWKLCKHDQNRCSAERGARHIVCMMERALAQSTAWDQKIIGMCDCSDVTPANLDLAMLRIAIPLMQEQYPEVQSQTLLFPSGWLTSSLYAIISPMMTSGTKKKFKFVSDAEARTILKGAYDIDQIDECYGGTLIRGPLFSLPGNACLRPDAAAREAEPSDSGLGDESAASHNLLMDDLASSPSRGPRYGLSPIKGSRHAAAASAAASRANGQSGEECHVVAKSLVPEQVSASVAIPTHRQGNDPKGGAVRNDDGLQEQQETEVGGEGAESQSEQAVEKETGLANPASSRRRQHSSNMPQDSTLQAVSKVRNQDEEVGGAPAPSRSGAGAGAGAKSLDVTWMMKQSAVCAAVVGAAAFTAAASRSGDSQDIVSAVTSMCTLFASAIVILTYSTRA